MRKITITDNMTPLEKMLIDKGMTRTELAKQSGVPIRTLETWAHRQRIPTNVYQLYKVSQVLGCTIEDLLEPELLEDGQQGEDQPAADGKEPPNE